MNPHLTKLINELSTSVNEFEKLSSEELPKDTTFYKYLNSATIGKGHCPNVKIESVAPFF